MMNGIDEQTKGAIIDHQNDADYWMEYRHGNILNETDLDYIVHQCNCFHVMGTGVAAAISTRWPKAYESDLISVYGDRNKMGTYTKAVVTQPIILNDTKVNRQLTIVNLYGQFTPGRARTQRDVDATKKALINGLTMLREEILTRAEHNLIKNRKYYIGIPWMISCGIYGLNVNEIFELIRNIFYDYGQNIKIIFVDLNN